jgi:hypothetical protein
MSEKIAKNREFVKSVEFFFDVINQNTDPIVRPILIKLLYGYILKMLDESFIDRTQAAYTICGTFLFVRDDPALIELKEITSIACDLEIPENHQSNYTRQEWEDLETLIKRQLENLS